MKLGGWMLVSLKEAVEEQHHQANRKYRIDLMDILIATTSYMAKTFETQLPEDVEYPRRKCTAVFEHCLYKELYFSCN